MATVALQQPDGRLADPDGLVETWRDRINQAREHRKQFEPIWLSNLAFAAGQHWLAWDDRVHRMRHLSELDDFYASRELYTADVITEQRVAALGELATDDDRPELLLAQQSDTAEQLQKEINAAVAHGWEYEWGSDQALRQARRLCLDLGVSAIRCRFDPTLGPKITDVPVLDGQPITDPEQARQLLGDGPREDVAIKTIHEGRTVWEPLSALNLLTPPGVNHEDAFPWEVIVRPVLISKLEEEYGDVAVGLDEDGDIASVIGLSTQQQARLGEEQSKGRLRGHAWLFTCFERPCRKYPDGQVVILASNAMRLLHSKDELPYEAPDKTRRSGVHYLHWWRLNDRFQSRAFTEGLKDPQRMINRRKTQQIEINDRSMPFILLGEGTLPQKPAGRPMEYVEVKNEPNSPTPQIFAGPGPNEASYRDIEGFREDLAHASTLSALRLGENPQGVDTYSTFAVLNENEQLKREEINSEHHATIGLLVEDSVYDIRRYWPEEKQILVSGDEGAISREVFAKSRIPDFYVVRVATGSSKPRSQGAELKKIDAIWLAALQSGVIVTDPHTWVKWYTDSIEAGQALELPEVQPDSQTERAHFENFLMLDQGEEVEPTDYDLVPVHVPIHREAQDQARSAGDMEAYARVQAHLDATMAVAAANAARMAAQLPPPEPGVEPGAQPPAQQPPPGQ